MEQIVDHDAWHEFQAQKRREAGESGPNQSQGPLGTQMSDEEAQELLNDPELFDPEWEHESLILDESAD